MSVNYLREKYGNVQNIIKNLHWQLEKWSARNTQMKDQLRLYDQLQAITMQLESNGENLESPWLLSKILCKFSEKIQRWTLKEKGDSTRPGNLDTEKTYKYTRCDHKARRRGRAMYAEKERSSKFLIKATKGTRAPHEKTQSLLSLLQQQRTLVGRILKNKFFECSSRIS